MGDYEKGTTTKGVVKGVKLNVEKEKSNGTGSFTANIFQFETDDGDIVKHVLPAKSAAGKYVARLKVGDKISVKTGGKFNSVLAVFQNDGKFNKGGKGSYQTGQTKTYDSTGAIQGMVLKASLDLVCASRGAGLIDPKGNLDSKELQQELINAAKEILKAKTTIDKMVIEALKGDKEDDDRDDDFSDNDSSDTNHKRNKEVDDDFGDANPY